MNWKSQNEFTNLKDSLVSIYVLELRRQKRVAEAPSADPRANEYVWSLYCQGDDSCEAEDCRPKD